MSQRSPVTRREIDDLPGGDVASKVHAIESDCLDALVRARPRDRKIIAGANDREDAAASGDDGAILVAPGASVKDHRLRDPFFQPIDRFSGLVGAGIAS